MFKKIILILLIYSLILSCKSNTLRFDEELTDPYLWLEEVMDENALNWVKEQNKRTSDLLEGTESFEELENGLLDILNSKERIPYVKKCGLYYYNFWKDDENPRGIWKRTTFEEYKKGQAKWEIILDIDKLGKEEGVSWVWNEAKILKPQCKLALIYLSRGGADANVIREFDIEKKEFVKEGFQIPEAKGEMSWIDKNSIYVATDFGDNSLTNSGYPRIVKLWERGTSIEEAKVIFEGEKKDIEVGAYYDDTKGFERHFVYRMISFYESELFLLEKSGKLKRIEIPIDAKVSVHREWLLVELRKPLKIKDEIYKEGSLLAIKFEEFINGKKDFKVIFEPTQKTSLYSYDWTLNYLVLNVLDNVKNRIFVIDPKNDFEREELKVGSGFSTLNLWAVDEQESDDLFITLNDFITPTTLYLYEIRKELEKLKQTPAFFDSSNFEISQHFAISKDGTSIPYFKVSKKGLILDSSNKTLLTGYGGFEYSNLPYYSGVIGYGWLKKGASLLLQIFAEEVNMVQNGINQL